jgi:hypothetical protein
MNREPMTELHPAFSSDQATPTPWSDAVRRLEEAEIFWISTVRPEGRPHVTPLIAVWLDGSLCFCTGPTERKAKNLAANPECVLTTGDSSIAAGLDVVVEGDAVRVRDRAELVRIAAAYEAKYGTQWRFEVGDEAFVNDGNGQAYVFEVTPRTVFGFGKGEPFSQTRWRFDAT